MPQPVTKEIKHDYDDLLDPFAEHKSLDSLPIIEVGFCRVVACASNEPAEKDPWGSLEAQRRRYMAPYDVIASKCLTCKKEDRLVLGEDEDFAEVALLGMDRVLAKCTGPTQTEENGDIPLS